MAETTHEAHADAPFQPIATFEELKEALDRHHAPNSASNLGERLACMILSVDEKRLEEIMSKWKDEDWPVEEYGEGGPMEPVLTALESLTARRALVDEAMRRAILVLGVDPDEEEGQG